MRRRWRWCGWRRQWQRRLRLGLLRLRWRGWCRGWRRCCLGRRRWRGRRSRRRRRGQRRRRCLWWWWRRCGWRRRWGRCLGRLRLWRLLRLRRRYRCRHVGRRRHSRRGGSLHRGFCSTEHHGDGSLRRWLLDGLHERKSDQQHQDDRCMDRRGDGSTPSQSGADAVVPGVLAIRTSEDALQHAAALTRPSDGRCWEQAPRARPEPVARQPAASSVVRPAAPRG